jgi:signal transduction histidine kinase
MRAGRSTTAYGRLLRMGVESVINAGKHGGASDVTVTVDWRKPSFT